MAIVRTRNTDELVEQLADAIRAAFGAGGDVARDVDNLAETLASIAPALSDEGANLEGTESWKTLIGNTSASHIVTLDDHQSSPAGPYYNGTERAIFSGTNLDGANALAAQWATRFTYSSDLVGSMNVPGFIASLAQSKRVSAAVEFNRKNPGQVVVANFTSLETTKEHASGFEDGALDESGTVNFATSKSSISFTGTSTFDVTAQPKLLSASLKSVTLKSDSSQGTEGYYADSAKSSSTSAMFQVSSRDGLDYSLVANSIVLSGDIATMTMNLKIKTFEDSESGIYNGNFQHYFRYTNSSAPGDEINLLHLQNYLNTDSQVNLTALREELLKGNDTITVTDHVDGGEIYAGAGNDKVIGGKAGDNIAGQEGDDILLGGDGYDVLVGGDGEDVIKGGNGNDWVSGDAGNDTIDGGNGNDLLFGGLGNDRIVGGAGHDAISGQAGNDTLDGGLGNDLLAGDVGNDLIKGGAGNDNLHGMDGDDILDGGAGNDLLSGGVGRDVMTGGSGRDGFAFQQGDSGDLNLTLASLDRITDFNVAQDRLQFLEGVSDVYVLTSGDTAQLGKADSYTSLLAAAETKAFFFVVGYDNANTYVFADLDEDGTFDFAVQLVGIKGDAVANALVFEAVLV